MAASTDNWAGAPPLRPAVPLAPAVRPRGGLAFAWLLLFLACLPDAMLPPLLRVVVVERFGASEPQAHWFAAINLVGALAALPALLVLRRLLAPATLVAAAAAANALLLACLAVAPDLSTALVLRAAEGAADMVVLAALLDLFAKAGGPQRQGRRFGVASMVIMVGLAAGAVIGGLLGRAGWGGGSVFAVGAGACALLALLAALGAPLVRRTIASCPVMEHDPTLRSGGPPLWVAALMMGSDRMLAGLLTSTVPLMLASRLGWSTERIGGLIAVPLLLMAVAAYPAGRLADRVGVLFTRTCAALAYAIALATIPVAGETSAAAMLVALLVLGFAASALMPTAMTMAARSGRGAVAMGGCQAAGNVGYLLGIAGAGWLLGVLDGPRPSEATYALVIELFALAHVVCTGIVLSECLARRDGTTRGGRPASAGPALSDTRST